MKQLMLGNKALARGLYEAGCSVVSSYPGTPSTEVTEEAAKYDEIYCEWAPNEKVAMEVAFGASLAGKRSVCGMKHVGLNVAADPLFTCSYTGVNGGMVICVADDPGMHSSQNEQDSRHYAKAAKVPMLEPSDSQEALAGVEFQVWKKGTSAKDNLFDLYYADKPLCERSGRAGGRRKSSGCDNGSGFAGKIYESLERGWNQSDSGGCVCCPCEADGAVRSRCTGGRRHRSRRAYRREYDHGAGTSGSRCGECTGHCGRWNCRRTGDGCGIHAGSRRGTDWYQVCGIQRSTGSRKL